MDTLVGMDGFEGLVGDDVVPLVVGALVDVSVVVGTPGDDGESDCVCVPELPLQAADVVATAQSTAAMRRRRFTGRTP
jgi:hypothetical protein